ncbi:TIGR02444 family protein [Shewanella colwelliana]|uniref:TIGR02444 family protein n=1 Tax=Shewanella colwelliana TaxID=23 RepID=UPI0037350517
MTYLNQFDLSLWQECDTLYANGQRGYLQLQDDYGVNVNLLLLATWLDGQAYRLSTQAWEQLFTQIDSWEEKVLKPYRKLRKLSKCNLADSEYQQMLDVELMLERKAQALILHKVRQLPDESREQNLPRYLSLFGVDLSQLSELQIAATEV